MFAQALNVRGGTTLHFEPVRSGVISWNTLAPAGSLRFRILRAGSAASAWYDYVQWQPSGRKSLSASSDRDGVNVDVDVLQAEQPFDGLQLLAEGIDFNLVAFAAPTRVVPSLPYARDAMILDVPARSQYVLPEERGWCSAASLSMVNAYHGIDRSVEETARAVLDRAYNGTGNWAFNTAFSGSLGLRAAVAYLQNLDQAARLIERNLPVIISYSWREGELPGAPIPHSDGHLVVLRGFTENGDCAINDPAADGVRVVYPRGAIEAIWQRNNGVAYVVAPAGIDYQSVLA
ncbi:MAG TPA: C39 family peptidase [Candidatus Aquilonibacter sp.]